MAQQIQVFFDEAQGPLGIRWKRKANNVLCIQHISRGMAASFKNLKIGDEVVSFAGEDLLSKGLSSMTPHEIVMQHIFDRPLSFTVRRLNEKALIPSEAQTSDRLHNFIPLDASLELLEPLLEKAVLTRSSIQVIEYEYGILPEIPMNCCFLVDTALVLAYQSSPGLLSSPQQIIPLSGTYVHIRPDSLVAVEFFYKRRANSILVAFPTENDKRGFLSILFGASCVLVPAENRTSIGWEHHIILGTLHSSAISLNVELLNDVLSSTYVNTLDTHQRTALIVAAASGRAVRAGDAEVAAYVQDFGDNVISDKVSQDTSLLLYMERLLCEEDLAVDLSDEDGHAALHFLSARWQHEGIGRLLESGRKCNVNRRGGGRGMTPLHYACSCVPLMGEGEGEEEDDPEDDLRIIRNSQSIDHSSPVSPWREPLPPMIRQTSIQPFLRPELLSHTDCLLTIRTLLYHGAYPNATSDGGKTPLDILLDANLSDVLSFLPSSDLHSLKTFLSSAVCALVESGARLTDTHIHRLSLLDTEIILAARSKSDEWVADHRILSYIHPSLERGWISSPMKQSTKCCLLCNRVLARFLLSLSPSACALCSSRCCSDCMRKRVRRDTQKLKVCDACFNFTRFQHLLAHPSDTCAYSADQDAVSPSATLADLQAIDTGMNVMVELDTPPPPSPPVSGLHIPDSLNASSDRAHSERRQTVAVHSEADKEIMTRFNTRRQEREMRRTQSAREKATKQGGTMAGVYKNLDERGDRLNRMEDLSDRMAQGGLEYKSNSRKIREEMEKKKNWPF